MRVVGRQTCLQDQTPTIAILNQSQCQAQVSSLKFNDFATFRLKFQNPTFACRCAQPDKNHIRTRVRAHVVRTRVRAHVVRTRVRAHVVRTRVRAHVVRTCVRSHVRSAKIFISNSLSDSHAQQRWRTSIPDARSYPGSAVHSPMMLFVHVSQPITCSIIG